LNGCLTLLNIDIVFIDEYPQNSKFKISSIINYL